LVADLLGAWAHAANGSGRINKLQHKRTPKTTKCAKVDHAKIKQLGLSIVDFVEKLVIELIRTESAPRIYRHDHFRANIHETRLKLDLLCLRLPLFSIKGGNKQPVEYQQLDYSILVKPGLSGQPSIKDKEFLIFCISQLTEGHNRDRNDLSRKLRIVPHHFFQMFRRGTRGQDYSGLIETLERLKETTITIQMHSHPKIIHSFSLIQSWSFVKDTAIFDQQKVLEVELPEITIKQLENRQILTLSPLYVGVRSPSERRIYEVARSHCGNESEWKIGLQKLHEKTGSECSIEKFKWKLKSSPRLPDFEISINEVKNLVVFKKTSIAKSISPTALGKRHLRRTKRIG
jgi:hypothetical protein